MRGRRLRLLGPFALALVTLAPPAGAQGEELRAQFARAEAGWALLADERYEEALSEFERLLAEDPASEPARVGLADAAQRAGRDDVLDELVAESVERPEDVALRVALVHVRMLAPSRGVTWDGVAALRPDDPFLAFERARRTAGYENRSFVEIVHRGRFWAAVRTTQDPLPPAVRAHLAPWLRDEPTTLDGWYRFLTRFEGLVPDDLARARAAAESLPDSPLAAGVLVEVAGWMPDLGARWALLERVEEADPDGPFADDARLARARMLSEISPSARREAIELLEPIVARGAGNTLRSAARLLVDHDLADGRADAALELLDALGERVDLGEDRTLRVLRATERWDRAEALLRAELGAAGDQPDHARAGATWELGEVVLDAGRPDEALELFTEAVELDAASGSGVGDGLAASWSWLRALAGTYPYPIAATGMHLMVNGLAWATAFSLLAVRGRAARPLLRRAAALAALPAVLGVTALLVEGRPVGATDLAMLLAGFARNGTFAITGLLLLAPADESRRSPSGTALRIAVALVLMFGATALVLSFGEPEVHPFFEHMAGVMRHSEFAVLLDATAHKLEAALLASTAAVQEELLFRFALLGLFTRALAGRGRVARATGVLLASVLFAVPHAGMVDPEWIKFLQVTVLGCILGALALARGPLAAVVAHVAFNLAVVLAA